jgi:hypothetical protein
MPSLFCRKLVYSDMPKSAQRLLAKYRHKTKIQSMTAVRPKRIML